MTDTMTEPMTETMTKTITEPMTETMTDTMIDELVDHIIRDTTTAFVKQIKDVECKPFYGYNQPINQLTEYKQLDEYNIPSYDLRDPFVGANMLTACFADFGNKMGQFAGLHRFLRKTDYFYFDEFFRKHKLEKK